MGNQLAATPTVDLANVSADLELISPLGAEGRSYFATFHCLHYTPLTAIPTGESPQSDNAADYATDFFASDGSSSSRRSGYRPNSLYYPTNTTGPSSAAAAASPLPAYPPTRGAGRGRGHSGRLLYNTAATAAGISSVDAFSGVGAAEPTCRISASSRAAWHQARWRQRLPVAARPWRTSPSMFVGEGAAAVLPSAEMLERWCRDSAAGPAGFSSGLPSGGGARFDGPLSDYTNTPPFMTPSPSFTAGTPASAWSSPSPTFGAAQARAGTEMDATVAGVVGEWRGNYGNYVQLLLRGGAHSGLASAAQCDGKMIYVVSAPRAGSSSGSGGGAGVIAGAYGTRGVGSPYHSHSQQQAAAQPLPPGMAYVMHDVVTKVFVRAQEDPGQVYFLKRVRQMMDNVGEQLDVIDSTLPATTPRSCLWYTTLFEGDGFCVLQRPYVAFTLPERLAARPAWTAEEKLFVAFQILQAVAHLHETYGVTHGDLKPNNVLVQSTGMVVLCDMAPFKPWRLPLDSPLLFNYYYDTEETRACYLAPEKFSDQPLPTPPLESKTRGNATYNVSNLNFDGHTAAMDIFSTACVLLFLYKEEDPFTLSEVLSLRQLTTTAAREQAMGPVLRECGVPRALHPLLLSMLCAPGTDRPSARELLKRGFDDGVFPPSFAYLYHDVLPRLLTQVPDVRLRFLHNQLEAVFRRCADVDAALRHESVEAQQQQQQEQQYAAMVSLSSRERAVRILLPLLLQSIHSAEPTDEATFRGLLCLRQCVEACTFDSLTDFVLPHLVYVVNNDAHVYGSATRLVAVRLLCSAAEKIARRLTSPNAAAAAGCCASGVGGDSASDSASDPLWDEEQWALLEHLVLPCFYDVLRQSEQEATAVLVELAERLPRLLLLTRFLTERRQVLYGAEARQQQAQEPLSTQVSSGYHHPPSQLPPSAPHVARGDALLPVSDAEPGCGDGSADISGALDTRASPPPLQQDGGIAAAAATVGSATRKGRQLSDGKGDVIGGDAMSRQSSTDFLRVEAATEATEATDSAAVAGNATVGVVQYLAQLRCLLSNGWNMLQLLYNHASVSVVAAMMRQSAPTVAAFLGEERVVEDLIPLLTTSLTAPVRVLRVLFPQAILLHALLQRPQAKTLRLFVEEGLRQTDDVCVKATLDSMAVVVRGRRLPLEDVMSVVHQSLPFLMDGRLWLREAACGVVEAAAQSYPASDVALHFEYAVRPLLVHPVPLSQLRRFAASIIRAELASVASGENAGSSGGSTGVASPTHDGDVEWSLSRACHADCPMHGHEPRSASVYLDCGHGSGSAATADVIIHNDYRDVLPAVMAATTHAYASSAAPAALLHVLPASAPAPPAAAQYPDTLSEALDGAAVLAYSPSARESSRLALEERAETPLDAAAATHNGRSDTPAPSTERPSFTPQVVALQPLPTSLAPHSSICRSGVVLSSARDEEQRGRSAAATAPSPPPQQSSALPPSPAPAGTVARSSSTIPLNSLMSSSFAASPVPAPVLAPHPSLRPVAAPLATERMHLGAIYTCAAAPSASGIVVSAGGRGEAIVWRVGESLTHRTHTRELALVERVPLPMTSAALPARVRADYTYTASQWMDGAVQLRDRNGAAVSATTTAAATVAFASTDGQVRVLDVECNTWLWSAAVGSGSAATALALHDASSLLVTTAAGGLHVVDTRCRDGSSGSVAWGAELDPLDGAPSCVVPLYSVDRACAAVVGTYGGTVCLYDLRFQLCAQRTVVSRGADSGRRGAAFATSAHSAASMQVTCGAVDPLSSLSRGSRPGMWEPAVSGPSVLMGTADGDVYRVLLGSNAAGTNWPAFQCRRGSGSVRCMLAQPATGTVLTGSDDGYIRHWSTDRPESSHTMFSAPYTSPPYTVCRGTAAAMLDAAAERRGGTTPLARALHGVKRAAALVVREGGDGAGGVAAQSETAALLPHHAPDAVLTLCASHTSSSSSSWSGAGEGHTFLLSGARDGSLTLWENVE